MIHIINEFCIITFWGYIYSKGYVDYFSPIFQGLRLFKGLCLFRTLEQVFLLSRLCMGKSKSYQCNAIIEIRHSLRLYKYFGFFNLFDNCSLLFNLSKQILFFISSSPGQSSRPDYHNTSRFDGDPSMQRGSIPQISAFLDQNKKWSR